MRKIITFDDFVAQCEHFYCHEEINVNNSYNCKHSKQEYLEEGIGCCYSWTCPFGYEAEKEDFEDELIDNNGFEYNEDWPHGLFIVDKTDNNIGSVS